MYNSLYSDTCNILSSLYWFETMNTQMCQSHSWLSESCCSLHWTDQLSRISPHITQVGNPNYPTFFPLFLWLVEDNNCSQTKLESHPSMKCSWVDNASLKQLLRKATAVPFTGPMLLQLKYLAFLLAFFKSCTCQLLKWCALLLDLQKHSESSWISVSIQLEQHLLWIRYRSWLLVNLSPHCL